MLNSGPLCKTYQCQELEHPCGKGGHWFPPPNVTWAFLLCDYLQKQPLGWVWGSGCPSQEEEQMGTGAQGDWFMSHSLVVMVDLKHEWSASGRLPIEGTGTDQDLVTVFGFWKRPGTSFSLVGMCCLQRILTSNRKCPSHSHLFLGVLKALLSVWAASWGDIALRTWLSMVLLKKGSLQCSHHPHLARKIPRSSVAWNSLLSSEALGSNPLLEGEAAEPSVDHRFRAAVCVLTHNFLFPCLATHPTWQEFPM